MGWEKRTMSEESSGRNYGRLNQTAAMKVSQAMAATMHFGVMMTTATTDSQLPTLNCEAIPPNFPE
jgi:hypothetical protein